MVNTALVLLLFAHSSPGFGADCDVSFVGVRHGSEETIVSNEIQREVRAGRAMMGAEGVAFGDPEVAKVHGDKVQGIEDGNRSMFSGLLLNYGFMAVKLADREYDARFNLLLQVRTNSLFRSVLLGQKQGVEPLSATVKSTPAFKLLSLVSNPKLSLKEAEALFRSQLEARPQAFPTSDWMKISKVLPSFKHPLVQPEKVLHALNHPESAEAGQYLTQELNLKWRNEAIRENMKKIIQHGCKQKKKVYLMIGAWHLDELRGPLTALGAKEMSPDQFGMPGPRVIMPDFQPRDAVK